MSESAVADEIGRIGESFFDFITSKTNLLVGKIDPDRMGKDRVVEAKLAPRDEGLSFDKRPAPMACSIQIKTVLRTTKVVTLSLSVAERLAQTLQPAFIYIVRLDDDREVFEVRAVHILGDDLAKILKRLRKEFAAGTKSLHDKNVTFQIKDAKKLGLTGDDLATFLMREIGPDMDKYSEKKSGQKSTLGYEAGKSITVNGSFEAEKIGDLIDGLLGLRPLAVAKLMATEERFGISLPVQRFPNFQPGTLAHITPKPSARCTLIIKSIGDEESVEIQGDLILPPSGWLPIAHFKILLRAPFLEATFSHDTFSLRTIPEWSVDQQRRLADWISYSSALSIFSKGSCEISVRTVVGVEHLGVAKIEGLLDTHEAKTQLHVLKSFLAIRQQSEAPDRPLKIDDILDNWSKILQVHDHLTGEMPSNFSFPISNPKESIPEEVEFLLLIGFSVADECYAYGMRCIVRTEASESDLLVRQASSFKWVDISPIGNLEEDFARYRSRLFRLSGVELCLSSILEEESMHVSGPNELNDIDADACDS